jgi:hypothetical protein
VEADAMTHGNDSDSSKKAWLDRPESATKIFWILCAVCALLFLADALYVKHPHFAAESWFGFYGIFGFVAFFGVVLAGAQLRKILMRKEDYYD